MVTNYNIYNTSIGRLSIDADLKNATAFGGAIPLLDYVEKIELIEHLKKNITVSKQGETYSLPEVMTALVLGRLFGIERVYHFEDLEHEALLKRFFHWNKLPDYTTYYHDLQRFQNDKDIEGLQATNEQLIKRILSKQKRVILDFDSSVNTVYGKRERAEVGYNPRDPGKNSHHPLYVFEGNTRLCLYSTLRSGKAYTSTGMVEAATESLKQVPSDATVMARFDKGFPNDTHLSFFEEYRNPDTGFPKEISYVGKLKLYRNIVKKGLKENWCRVYEGTKIIEWTETQHQAQSWSKSRRVILIRTAEASDFDEPYLSEEFIWEYQMLVTNMDDDGDAIWRFYNHRASMENHIKESKNGFGSDQISNNGFYANYADLWLKMLAYNIYILFGLEICQSTHRRYTIARFRRKFLMIPARLITHARQTKLKLSNTFNHFSEWLNMLKRVHQLE